MEGSYNCPNKPLTTLPKHHPQRQPDPTHLRHSHLTVNQVQNKSMQWQTRREGGSNITNAPNPSPSNKKSNKRRRATKQKKTLRNQFDLANYPRIRNLKKNTLNLPLKPADSVKNQTTSMKNQRKSANRATPNKTPIKTPKYWTGKQNKKKNLCSLPKNSPLRQQTTTPSQNNFKKKEAFSKIRFAKNQNLRINPKKTPMTMMNLLKNRIMPILSEDNQLCRKKSDKEVLKKNHNLRKNHKKKFSKEPPKSIMKYSPIPKEAQFR